MNTIILCAGQGTRLKPLTNDKPKCMVELFGKPLLNWQIDILHECGINDITIVTGYKKEVIDYDNITFFSNPDFSSTNMVETLFCANKVMFDNIIVSYGDIIYEKSVLDSLISSNDEISVVVDQNWKDLWELRFKNPLDDAESLEIDSSGNISEIGQKVTDFSKIHGQFIGLMKFQGNGLEYLNFFLL